MKEFAEIQMENMFSVGLSRILGGVLAGLVAVAMTLSSCSKVETTSESSSGKAQAAESEKASASGSEMIMIFDGTDNKISEPETASLEKLFKSTIYPAAKKYWESDDAPLEFEVDPESEHSIEGVAEGAFTESGKKQKAVLYRFSETGHGFCTNGIVVMEGDNVVAHYAYQGGSDYSLTSIPDLNKNGKNELAIEGGSTNQGETESSINIVELSSSSIKSFGSTTTASDNEGSLDEKKVNEAYQIFAKSSAEPEYFAKKVDLLAKKTASNSSQPEPIKLEESDIKFALVK